MGLIKCLHTTVGGGNEKIREVLIKIDDRMISNRRGANTYNYPCLLHLRTNVSQNDARVKKIKKIITTN